MKHMLCEAEQGEEEADCSEGLETADLQSMTHYINI